MALGASIAQVLLVSGTSSEAELKQKAEPESCGSVVRSNSDGVCFVGVRVWRVVQKKAKRRTPTILETSVFGDTPRWPLKE